MLARTHSTPQCGRLKYTPKNEAFFLRQDIEIGLSDVTYVLGPMSSARYDIDTTEDNNNIDNRYYLMKMQLIPARWRAKLVMC